MQKKTWGDRQAINTHQHRNADRRVVNTIEFTNAPAGTSGTQPKRNRQQQEEEKKIPLLINGDSR